MGERDADTVRETPGAEQRERARVKELAAGDSIGRFVILELLGAGGMGVVYSAYDAQLDRRVAIKLLASDTLGDRDAEVRLLREAQAMAKIDHPNVIKVHEVGEHGSQVYLAMEYSDAGTLRRWLDERPHELPEIVATFLQAARGLAAAHDAALVHRDFKPENVLVSKNGAVRVTDFGLVSATHEPVPALPPLRDSVPPGSALSTDLTRTGAVMGTPSYMAPEQFNGEPASPAADQFAFCVALFEACYGMRPFHGETPIALAESVKSGELVKLPATARRVPERIRRAIVRGLSVDPARRFPSMTALIAELEHQEGPRRAWLAAVASVAVAAIAVSAALIVRRDNADVCTGARDRLAIAWNPEAQDRIDRAFAASHQPGVRALGPRVLGLVDQWGHAWEASYVDACRATRVRGEQSEHVLDLRMQCLTRRLEDARLTFEALGAGGDDALLRGPEAVLALGVNDCADVAALSSAAPVRGNLVVRGQIAAIRGELAAAAAEYHLAHDANAIAIARRAAGEARVVGDLGVLGEALLMLGEAQTDAGDKANDATLDEAVRTMAQAGNTAGLIDAMSWRVYALTTTSQHTDVAIALAQVADGLAASSAPPADVAVRIANAHALLLSNLGDKRAAAARYERALAFGKAHLPPEHPRVLDTMMQLANVEREQGRLADARKLLEEVLAIREKQLGPDHPSVASVLNNLGIVARHEGKDAEARKDYERALAINIAAYGEQHPEVGTDEQNLGSVDADEQDDRAALDHYKKCLAIWEAAYGPDSPELATVLTNIGSSLYNRGDYAGARQALERSIALYEKALGPDAPGLVADLINLGNVAKDEGKYDEALALYQRAIAITEKRYGPEHEDIADSLLNIATVYSTRKQYKEEKAVYARLLTLVPKVFGEDHPRVGMMMSNYGSLLSNLGDHAGALAAYQRALAIFEAKLGPQHTYVSYALLGIGNELDDLHRSKEALPYLERAVAIRVAAQAPAAQIDEAKKVLEAVRANAGH